MEATPENARRLIEALSQWGEGYARELSETDFCPPELGSVRIGEDFVLDIFTLLRSRSLGADFDYVTLASDAESIPLSSGGRVTFLSVTRLIDLKSDSGRPKDEADIAVLRELRAHRGQRIPVNLEQLEPISDPTGSSGSEQGEWSSGPVP